MTLAELQNLPSFQWPEDAADTLHRVLTDASGGEEDRGLAAALAGDPVVMGEELTRALLAILENGSEPASVQASAAISLGPMLETMDTEGLDDPEEAPVAEETFRRAQAVLRKLHSDESAPAVVRRCALEAAVRAPEDWQADAVRAAWQSEDVGWKTTAVFAMGYVRGFEKEILSALRSPNDEVHLAAVTSAGNAEVEEAWGHVAELVKAKNTPKPLRIAAIEAASTIDPDKASRLLEPLVNHKDPEIAGAAEEAVAMSRAFAAMDEEDDDFF